MSCTKVQGDHWTMLFARAKSLSLPKPFRQCPLIPIKPVRIHVIRPNPHSRPIPLLTVLVKSPRAHPLRQQRRRGVFLRKRGIRLRPVILCQPPFHPLRQVPHTQKRVHPARPAVYQRVSPCHRLQPLHHLQRASCNPPPAVAPLHFKVQHQPVLSPSRFRLHPHNSQKAVRLPDWVILKPHHVIRHPVNPHPLQFTPRPCKPLIRIPPRYPRPHRAELHPRRLSPGGVSPHWTMRRTRVLRLHPIKINWFSLTVLVCADINPECVFCHSFSSVPQLYNSFRALPPPNPLFSPFSPLPASC